MPEVRSVLFLPHANLDLPTWARAGCVACEFPLFEDGWHKKVLLDPKKPLAVVLSVPSSQWDESLREPWEHEKKQLTALFLQLRGCMNPINLIDLSMRPAELALKEVTRVLREYEQILGIAHVGIEERCRRCNSVTDNEGISQAIDSGQEPTCPRCGSLLTRYIEVGDRGRLDAEVLDQTCATASGRASRERTAIFLGCETLKSDLYLPRAFLDAGLSAAFLSTREVVTLDDMLTFLTALIVAGYGHPGHLASDKAMSCYLKLRSLQQEGVRDSASEGRRCTLFLEGASDTRSAVPTYYAVERCREIHSGTPHLTLVPKDALLNELRKAASCPDGEGPIVIDAPHELRADLARSLSASRALWAARGTTCQAVAAALLRADVEYHIGYMETGSEYLVYSLLRDYYVCVSPQGLSGRKLLRLIRPVSAGRLRGHDTRDLLLRLAGVSRGRPVVAAVRT